VLWMHYQAFHTSQIATLRRGSDEPSLTVPKAERK
jgi:hypothetical protein